MKILLLAIIPLSLLAETPPDPLPQVPSRDMQRAIDSRDAKIIELQKRIEGLLLKLEGFGAVYNACEGLSRMPIAPAPIPVRPFTPENKMEEK